jgi:uncharacterized protein YjbI with pentapeptide repeats
MADCTSKEEGAAVANPKHVEILKKGVAEWNEWRRANPTIYPDLRGANLNNADLRTADLRAADLRAADLRAADLRAADLRAANLSSANLGDARLGNANLSNADLSGANLSDANLSNADLSGANLSDAGLYGAHLGGAHLGGANLGGANLNRAVLYGAILIGVANLNGAYLTNAFLGETVFGNVDLSSVIGLDTCDHGLPSTIDHRTLRRSGPLPPAFLRGVGLPDNFIEYIPSLFNQAIQLYSCFISYSTKDDEFAKRLYADLQNKGIRCWFAPHDLPIGAKTWDTIDEAIKLRDKVLLILSKNSIESDWVEDEVQKAFAEERDRKELVLFPVRIDDAVMETPEPWARKFRDQRHIGDFRRWKDHDAYKQSFERVVRDLVVKPKAP